MYIKCVMFVLSHGVGALQISIIIAIIIKQQHPLIKIIFKRDHNLSVFRFDKAAC